MQKTISQRGEVLNLPRVVLGVVGAPGDRLAPICLHGSAKKTTLKPAERSEPPPPTPRRTHALY